MSKAPRSMTKAERREQRKAKRMEGQIRKIQEMNPDFEITNTHQQKQPKPLKALTEAQGHYIIGINDSKLTFGIGPAGTGKTYVCGALAAKAILDKEMDKIIITRPAVEAGESFGFLPGDLEEKYEPYIRPFRDVLDERLGKSRVDHMLKVGEIEAVPLAFMRGRTFKNAFVILDEAQNSTVTQMKMFLTRIGNDSKVVVNGDPRQIDIKETSGLMDAVNRLEHMGDVRVANFNRGDVVRSGLVQQIIEAYEH